VNGKTLARWALLVVALGASAAAVWRLRDSAPPPQAERERFVAEADAELPRDGVVVTYFTTSFRCATCRTIEDLSRRAVQDAFAREIEAGTVVFRVLDTDEPRYAHFVEQYDLSNKTVVVSKRSSGREVEWCDQQDVWSLYDEPDSFFEYVRAPVRRYLDGS
jgi:hypothetical protein